LTNKVKRNVPIALQRHHYYLKMFLYFCKLLTLMLLRLALAGHNFCYEKDMKVG